MKKCPYCAELIKEEAVKCRFCHEKIDNTNSKSLFDILSNSKDQMLEKYSEYKKNKTKHLRLPTDDEGWTIGNTQFFLNELIIDNRASIEYSEIISIFFKAETTTRNFVTNRKVIWSISGYHIDENGIQVNTVVELPLLSRKFKFINLNKKAFEIILLLHSHISKISFDNRLFYYKKQLKENNYFTYIGYQFHNDGKVYNNKKKCVADLKGLNLNDVSFSSEWSGLKSSHENPYEFRILNGLPQVKLFFGLIQTGQNFKIDTLQDNDVFNLMIYSFLQNGKYIV